MSETIILFTTLIQAIKEEKMENTLAQLKERWAHIVWGMDPYKGGDVPLLKIAEEDFEALEVHRNDECFMVLLRGSQVAHGHRQRG